MSPVEHHQNDILIVDDESANLEVLWKLLANYGYHVRPVRKGETALDSVRKDIPDLILLDIMMPGMNGFEVFLRLKANQATRKIPVIFLTALTDSANKMKAFELGAVDYITKPFRPEEVLARVNAQIVQCRLRKQLEDQNRRLQDEIAARQAREVILQQYERIVSTTPDLISLIDADYVYQLVNEAYLRAHRKQYSDIVNHSAAELHGEKVFETLLRPHLDRCLSGEIIQYQAWFDYAGLGRRFMNVTYSPYLEQNGVISGVMVSVRDLTEHKHAEKTIQQERQMAKKYLEIAGVMLLAIATDGTVSMINKKGCDILGYPQEEIIGQNWFETYLFPEERLEVETLFTQLLYDKSEHTAYAEGFVRTRSGEKRLIAWNNTVIRDEDEKLRGTLSSGEDITERKLRQEALRESEERFRLSFENANIGMCLVDLDGRLLRVNPKMCHIFGYTQEELEQITVNDLSHPAYLNVSPSFIQKAASGETEHAIFEKQYFHKDGHLIWGQVSSSLVRDRDGNPLYFISHIEDTTKRKQAEKALKKTKESAEAANRSKSLFLANMSHELRTPLNIVMGYTQNLQNRKTCPPETKEELETIYQASSHLLTVINDVLDIAKIGTQKLELIPHEMHLPRFLEKLSGFSRIQAEEKSLGFSDDFDGGLPLIIKADEKRLRQVLLNLLNNAIRFTARGQVVLRVNRVAHEGSSSTDAHHSKIRFEVEDTGPGLMPEQIERIFQPFEQLRTADNWHEGTGAGLTIGNHLVHAMGGTLHVKSEPGQGSLFSFEIDVPVLEDSFDMKTNVPTELPISLSSEEREMIPPPQKHLDKLFRFAQLGMMDRIEEYTEKLDNFEERYRSFLELVKQLAHNYEDEKLLELFGQYQDQKLKTR